MWRAGVVALIKGRRVAVPDDLSDWVMPPPSGRDPEPVRVFDSAEDAMAFLRRLRATKSDLAGA
jgi:hypothetical protein